jgi:hypothetical protein
MTPKYDGEERRRCENDGNGVGWKKVGSVLMVVVPLLSLLLWMLFIGINEVNKKADRTELQYAEQKLIQRDHDLKQEFMEQISSTNAELIKITDRQVDQIRLLNELVGMHKK